MKEKIFVITAAGGNGTVIQVLNKPLTRQEYSLLGNQLLNKAKSFGAEQAGFLLLNSRHLEMAGGEFCGNAARSGAIVFSEIIGGQRVTFTISGYKGEVKGRVKKLKENFYFVECKFPHLPVSLKEAYLFNKEKVNIVDLGGIVHVVLESPFPAEEELYKKIHKKIIKELSLQEKSAVGVIWIKRLNKEVKMHPVVWVKKVDTFFYEHSCGSGTIAVAKVTQLPSVIQPTGKKIIAEITPKEVILKSEMEVVYRGN